MINHSFALFITLLWIKFSKDPCHVVIIFWMALNMMVEPAPNRITSGLFLVSGLEDPENVVL